MAKYIPPRSLMVIHQFRPILAGTELQAERLAGRLIHLGHQVRVLTQRKIDGTHEYEVVNGVPVHRVSFELAYRYHTNLSNTFKYFITNRHDYDILHAHMAFGHAIAAIVAARWLGKRVLVKIAGAGSTGEMAVTSGFELCSWGRKVLCQADAIVAVSQFMREELLRYGIPEALIHYIPNGVDTGAFCRRHEQAPDNAVVFVVLGRRSQEKGFDTVLRAAKTLLDRGIRNFRVDHHGFDIPECDYRPLTHELGVNDVIRFLPFADNVAGVLQDAHAFILPSRNEGLSNALLEAMACELPVIATAISGTVDAVTDGESGLLIPPDDPRALADAMRQVIENASLRARLAANARKCMETNFSLDVVSKRYSALYDKLCQRQRSGT